MIQCQAAGKVRARLPVAADDLIPLIAHAWAVRAHARSDGVPSALQAALLAS
jgi:hypothetical protein